MSVHLRVDAELNDLVKPDEHDTVLRSPFRPHQHQMETRGKHRVASVQARF